MKILLVEDDKYIADNVSEYLTKHFFTVDHEADGEQGCHLAKIRKYDIIILDVSLPGKNWLQIAKEIRSSGHTTPIIMLTARDTIDDKISWLENGADDYIVKPFALPELLARVNALLRRTHYKDQQDLEHITVGDLSLDLHHKKVTRAWIKISLTKKQFQILEYLVRHANTVVTKNEMVQNIRWANEDRRSDVIRSHMQLIREKVDAPFEHKLIQTVRGMGFVLSEKVRSED